MYILAAFEAAKWKKKSASLASFLQGIHVFVRVLALEHFMTNDIRLFQVELLAFCIKTQLVAKIYPSRFESISHCQQGRK